MAKIKTFFCPIFILVFLHGCGGRGVMDSAQSVQSVLSVGDFTSKKFGEYTPFTIELPYTDTAGADADSCSVSELDNVTVSTPCACLAGACTVEVTAESTHGGSGSFSYSIVSGSNTSNTATVTLRIEGASGNEIYSNTAMTFPWTDQSWDDISLDFNNSGQVYTGASAVHGVFDSWGTFSSMSGDWGSIVTVIAGTYEAYAFEIYPVSNSGYRIYITGTGVDKNIYPPLGQWTSFSIPLSELNPDSLNWDRINMQTQGAGSEFYIDNIRLKFPDGGTPSVANDFSPPDLTENTESIITLNYTDADGDNATACEVFNLAQDIKVSQACSCSAGTCDVGITGNLNYTGSAFFDFYVISRGQNSNTATSTLSIVP